MAVMLVLVIATVGCGSTPDPAVLRIGESHIDAGTVKHWERIVTSSAGSKSSPVSPRNRAIDFLINGNRVLGEAKKQGLTIPSDDVKTGIRERLSDKKAPASTGRTTADLEFEVSTALAASKLREAIFRRVPHPTEAEIASYYTRHHRVLYPQEQRIVDLIEKIPSRSAAIALAKRLGAGQRFAKLAIHETVGRLSPQEEEQDLNGHLTHAVFAAPLHEVSGPVSYVGKWVIFVVRKADRGPLGLPVITAEVTERLLSAQRQQALRAFLIQYQHEWKSKTFCSAGYIVAGCSESHESSEPSTDLLAGA